MRHRFLTRLAAAVAAGLVIAATTAPMAGAAPDKAGFKTAQGSMLVLGPGAGPGSNITPLLTVGDVVGGFAFEAIPDGISLYPHGKGSLSLFINHETSTVPFAYVLPPTVANSQNDFDNSQVSEVKLHQKSAGVLNGEYIIPSASNYQRFCSNFLATSAQGFSRPIFFTNEEGIDWVNRTGTAWPATEGAASARQIGVVAAYDVKAERTRSIWGMGRLNHENNVALPGYGHPVLLSGDDAFVSNPAQSQVYSYIADDADAVWNDEGDLWAFVSDNAAINDYYDFAPNGGTSVGGHFIKVPKAIATGLKPDGTDMLAANVPVALGGPYPPPPADGSWQRGPGVVPPPAPAPQLAPGIDGPQWILEHWGDLNNVFSFVRIEDIATDKRPGMSNVVYMADSGRGATSPGFANGVDDALNPFTSTNGRIWKMVMDRTDPTKVTSLSILIEGDDNPVKTLNEIHQPDNLETTLNGLYITEDPGSSQQFNAAQQVSDAANATTARLWQYKLVGGATSVVAKVDQALDEQATDKDPSTTRGNWGAWESTGVVDASAFYGPGALLINVQAHTLWIEIGDGPGILAPTGPDWLNKREGGQLLLIHVAGG
jgi:hypothetical protein